MGDRRGSGHQSDYYHVHDQRFLGDQRFVEQIDERIRDEREIEIPHPRASFSKLVRLTAEANGVTERELVQMGHQREWAKVSCKEINRPASSRPFDHKPTVCRVCGHSQSRKENTAGTQGASQASSRISLAAVNHSEPND